MSKYAIKEIYYTLQGEGAQAGRPAVFLRFSGCNLWTGREEDRHKAICKFCDTDFWGTDGQNGGKYDSADKVVEKVKELWPKNQSGQPYIVCTGGEPMLQLDDKLIFALQKANFEVACETNGTLPIPSQIDWICMSPKANTEIIVTKGHELKVVFPQKGINPEAFLDYDFEHFYLQPMDNENQDKNIQACIKYCLEHPKWKLSVQMHKVIGMP